MTTKELDASKPGCSVIGFLVWFLGGLALSLSIIFSVILLALLVASIGLNIYLAWQLSGLQVAITRASPPPPQVVTATPATEALAVNPSETPSPAATIPPTPIPANVEVERQVGTVAAIVTQASTSGEPAAFAPATGTMIAAIPIDPSTSAGQETPSAIPTLGEGSTEFLKDPPPASSDPVDRAAVPVSSNTYQLIPIEGERESRPAETHGDLNLKLREPQPLELERSLVDAGVGVDPNAPKFSKIFKPNFSAVYTIHDWDWGCNCKGKLIEEKDVVLVGIKTTPGEPVYIPPRDQDIYDGKYYAVVLYASEDSLTFVYSRAGNVTRGYTIHYVGLQTDPNLVALFRESQGSQLPGLTLDTPVGVATGELIVAIRDNGKFLDARSEYDWWD